MWQRSAIDRVLEYRWRAIPPRHIPELKALVLDLRDFEAVGDGNTLNTEAFLGKVDRVPAETLAVSELMEMAEMYN